MRFVKNNLWMIISALVIVVLLLLYIPLSSWAGNIQRQMNERLQAKQKADSLIKATAKIPNNGKDGVVPGPITPQMAKVKEDQNKWMEKQSEEANKIASQANRDDRVSAKGAPLLLGKSLARFLPTFEGRADGYDFNEIYRGVIPRFFEELVPTAQTPKDANLVALAQPLTEEQIQRDIIRRRQESGVAGWGAADATMVLTDEMKRDALVARSRQIKMYVAPDAFQVRSFLNLSGAAASTKPDNQQIFEATVDTWVQQDLVKAIAATNARAANVTESPVKGLISIQVGAAVNDNAGGAASRSVGGPPNMAIMATMAQRSASGRANQEEIEATGHPASGNIFIGMDHAAAAGGPNPAAQMGFQMPGGAAQSTGPDYALSLTGHKANDHFDVTYVRITVDVDPSKINDFINNIYRQNNSYTVLNMSIQTVDPVTAASSGYLFGNTQVVRADILLEAIFFRDWTEPLMPKAVKTALGIASKNPADQRG